MRAAENKLDVVPTGKKKTYISRNTWAKIEQRNQLRRHGAPSQEVRRLNKEIYKEAWQDRQKHLIVQFNENPNDPDPHKKGLWRAVKGLKSKFTPPICTDKNERGKHVPITERAQAIADYLASKHWNNRMIHRYC